MLDNTEGVQKKQGQISTQCITQFIRNYTENPIEHATNKSHKQKYY